MISFSASSAIPQRMRVVLLIDTLNLGGTEMQMAQSALRLHKKGHSVTVGCLRAEGPLLEVLKQAGVPVVEFRKTKTLLSLNGLRQLFRLACFLRRGKFHAMHAWDLWSNLLGVPAGWIARTPIVISSRRYLADLDWYTPWRDRVMRLLYGFSTCVVVNSTSIRDLLVQRYRLPDDKIRVIHNAVDVDRFACHLDRAKYLPPIRRNSKTIAVLANLFPVKGHVTLIKAAQKICGLVPEAIFLLIGEGPERRALEQRAREAGIERNVLFLGQRQDIPELLACCDLGVLPSQAEAMPNSVLEMMAAGLPVVATSVGGIPEIIQHEVSGLLVPPSDAEALAGAMLRILQDPELAIRLARAGEAKVGSDFGFERLITRFEQLYCERSATLLQPTSRLPSPVIAHRGSEAVTSKQDVGTSTV